MNRKHTIAFECHNLEKDRYGVGRYLDALLDIWRQDKSFRQDFEILLYFKGFIPDNLRQLKARKRILKIPFLRPSFNIFYNILIPLFSWIDRPDLSFFSCYMLPYGMRGRTVVVIHDVVYEAHPDWIPFLKRIEYRILSRHAAKSATAVVTVSEFSKKEIVRYYNISPKKVFVIPNGIFPYFKPITDYKTLEDIKSEYKIKKKMIVFAGQILNRRYVAEAMRAFSKIASKFPEYQFLVIGRNLTYNPFIDIDSIARQINLGHGREVILRRNFAPHEDLAKLFNAAELLVWLSSYEGFGLPPVESAACGTAVLTSSFQVLRETLGDSVFLVDNPENYHNIAQVMEKALSNDSLRRKIAQEAQKRAEKFRWDSHAKKLQEVFHKILSQSSL